MIKVNIRSCEKINVETACPEKIDVAIESGIKIIKEKPDYYEGIYSATPSVAAQSFTTKDLCMRDSFTVAPIPYREEAGEKGITVIIG